MSSNIRSRYTRAINQFKTLNEGISEQDDHVKKLLESYLPVNLKKSVDFLQEKVSDIQGYLQKFNESEDRWYALIATMNAEDRTAEYDVMKKYLEAEEGPEDAGEHAHTLITQFKKLIASVFFAFLQTPQGEIPMRAWAVKDVTVYERAPKRGQIGVSVLSGVAVMVLLMPVNFLMAIFMRKWHVQQMRYKDERTKVVNEILNEIKNNPSIAFVSLAWMQDNTMRANITFGKKFDEYFYNRVLDALFGRAISLVDIKSRSVLREPFIQFTMSTFWVTLCLLLMLILDENYSPPLLAQMECYEIKQEFSLPTSPF
ncbi:unnamed protein product, partial [Mesorhabditis belari]|uniref:Uncharacterized protein n=1 Tax=Mesorhabditis belari TaxID=2138241 RepID=A0AAF3JBD5_9BILA